MDSTSSPRNVRAHGRGRGSRHHRIIHGSSPCRSRALCPAHRVQNWSPAVPPGVRHRKECWWSRNVESAVGAGSRRMARSGFAHRPLRARPLIPFHFTLDQNIKRDPFKSEDLEYKDLFGPCQARRSPSNFSNWRIKAGSVVRFAIAIWNSGGTKWKMSFRNGSNAGCV